MSVINTNMSSLVAQRNLANSNSKLAQSMERLSSGLRINNAKDDAAGLAISTRMTSQINGFSQAIRNSNDGISLVQTAEGGLQSITGSLQRIRQLAVQSANATNNATDRQALNNEAKSLIEEIQRVATVTKFNGTALLDGTFTAVAFQVGANASDSVSISSTINAQATQLGSAGTTFQATTSGSTYTSATGLVAGELTLNGFQVGNSQNGGAPGQSDSSAYSIAKAINAITKDTGVTATASQTVVSGTAATAFTAGIGADKFKINGIAVGAVAAGTDVKGQGANVAAAINLVSSQTGVTASANATTGKITLTALDGRDINIEQVSGYTSLLADTGLAAGNTHGTITLTSSSANGIVISGGNSTKFGLTTGTIAATTQSTVNSISSLSLLTAEGARTALDSIDGALDSINNARASLGAFNNRLVSVISNLGTFSENLTASRSRVMDVDFSVEATNMSQTQVLVQAGTAILSQSNQLGQSVLQLLR